jgi:hypothetical protein
VPYPLVVIGRVFLHWGVRLAAAWLAALVAIGFAAEEGWRAFRWDDRPDGNYGHTTIDLGGQWAMARMIVEGNGRRLYDRNRLRPLMERGFPRSDEPPGKGTSDVEELLVFMMGGDSLEASKAAGGLMAPLAAQGPLQAVTLLAAGQNKWGPEYMERVTRPQIGGALYPPIHAVLFAPVATLQPRAYYRALQALNLLCLIVSGWVVSRLTEGRVWWPVAIFALVVFPGFHGSLDLGQNAAISLVPLLIGWWQIIRGRPVVGGVVWGLLAYKPVWAVAFFPVLLLGQRWRAAAAMALTGVVLVVATLPVVGVQSWLDWRVVGQEAADRYTYSRVWIFLSRDLIGVPRRYLLEFDEYAAKMPRAPRATYLGRALLFAVGGVTVGIALWRFRRMRRVVGPPAAFLLLGAWLTCFHFMYYDSMLAALPVFVLFAGPGPMLPVRFLRRPKEELPAETMTYYRPPLSAEALAPPLPLGADGRRARWVVNSLPLTVLVFISVAAHISPHYAPSWEFPPWETFGLLLLWAWCGWRTLFGEGEIQDLELTP